MQEENQGAQRPTAWIVATALFAIAAIALAVWGFSTKSDLNDANDTIDSQKAQLAGQEKTASAKLTAAKAYGAKTLASYQRVRRNLLAEDTKEGDAEKRIAQEVAQLKKTRADLASAQGATEKADAALKVAKQETAVAAACARGTVGVIDYFFSSDNASRGAQRSMNKLEKLEPQCEEVLKGS